MADIQIEDITSSSFDATDKFMVRRGAGPDDHQIALVDPDEVINVATNLSYTAATRVLASSTGTDATLPLAGSDPGLMSAADKAKLDGLVREHGVLQADYTLTSTTAAQKLFDWSANGALTLASGIYRVRCLIRVTDMSATSGNAQFDLLGAGTATLDRVLWQALGIDNTTPTNAATRTGSASITPAGGAQLVAAAVGTAMIAEISGIFDVTVGGTLIPSIALANAAAAVVKAGSHFVVERIGDSGDAASAGWS